MTGFSVVCVYNDRDKLDRYLISSLNRQDAPFELLSVDNTAGRFASAAAVLNETAKKAKYDHLLFAHQDVELVGDTWLTDARKALARLRNVGAAGAAGSGRKGIAGNIWHGRPPSRAIAREVRKPVRVQTLDGCLMIVPGEVFARIPFDEHGFGGWYLYAADYCLDLVRAGYRVYVLPNSVYHESTGPADRDAWESARKALVEKHRDHVSMIHTTMGTWKT